MLCSGCAHTHKHGLVQLLMLLLKQPISNWRKVMEIKNDGDEDDFQLQLFHFSVNKAGYPGSI